MLPLHETKNKIMLIRSLILFSIIITFNTNVKAQNILDKSIIDSLYSRGLLTDTGKYVMNNSYEQYSPSKKSELLRFLSEVYGKEYLMRTNLFVFMSQISSRKRTDTSSIIKPDTNYNESEVITDESLKGKNFTPKGLSSSIMPGLGVVEIDLVPISRNVMGRNLVSTSQVLIDLNLVDKSIVDELLNRISDDVVPEHMMMYFYSFGMGELEKRPSIINELRLELAKWKSNDLIENTLEVNFNLIGEQFDLLEYSSSALVFKETNLPDDPFKAYKIIIDSISKLIEYDITLSKFDLTINDDGSDSRSKMINAEIRIHDGLNYYSDTLFYTYAGGNTSIEEGLKTNLASDIIHVINKVLIDKDDCRRLYYLRPQINTRNAKRMGLIILNKDQYSSIQAFKSSHHLLIGPHPENSLNVCVTSQIIDEAINIGLIDSAPSPENISNARSLVSAILMKSKLRIPKTYRIRNLTNKGFLELFSKASQGAIKFDRIKILKSSEDLSEQITFSLNENKYEYTLDTERSFDFGLYEYVSSIMNYDDEIPQFYNLGYNQYDIGLMYLSLIQKNWIEDNSANIWIGKF